MPDSTAGDSTTSTTATKDPPLIPIAILVILGVITWIFPALIAIQIVKRQNKRVWNEFQQNDIILATIYTVVLAIFGLYVLANITFIGAVWIPIYIIVFAILWFTGLAKVKATLQPISTSKSSIFNGPPIWFYIISFFLGIVAPFLVLMGYESRVGRKMEDKDYLKVLIFAFLGDIVIFVIVIAVALFSLGVL